MTHPDTTSPTESPAQKPLFLRQLSPEMVALLEQHFWCDFSDLIPAMKWDQKQSQN